MTGSEPTKTCTKCSETKPCSEFTKQPNCKDGYHTRCNACAAENARRWREANLERAREADRRRYAENTARREAAKQRARDHYAANREQHLAYKKAYYEAHPEQYEKSLCAAQCRSCRGCGKALDYGPGDFQIDHIVPISLGGSDIPANVQLMCPPCNRKKWATLEGQIHLPV